MPVGVRALLFAGSTAVLASAQAAGPEIDPRDPAALAAAPVDLIDPDREVLPDVAVPGELAACVSTLKDLHSNVLRLYQSRMDLMEPVSADLHAEITGTKLFGAQELRTELQYIAQSFRCQLFGLPGAGEMIKVRIQRAPLRLKSLRLVSGRLLVLGIGLSLVDYLTGEGAFHARIWRARTCWRVRR